jgi:hypothetical protein
VCLSLSLYCLVVCFLSILLYICLVTSWYRLPFTYIMSSVGRFSRSQILHNLYMIHVLCSPLAVLLIVISKKVFGSFFPFGRSKYEILLPFINLRYIGDLRWFWLPCLGSLVILLPNTFKLFGFPIFRFWAYLIKVIPETRRGH